MKILFDSKSSQVQVQQETGTRLTDLYGAIQARGWEYSESPWTGEPLTYDYLQTFDVICILTRLEQTAPPQANKPPPKHLPKYPPGTIPGPYTNPFPENTSFQYTPDEIAAIQSVVGSGQAGLLLISDHGPFKTDRTDNQTINDCQLAAAFGVELQPATFEQGPAGLPQVDLLMSRANGSLNPSSNPLIDEWILKNVSAIQVHNSCAIFPLQGLATTGPRGGPIQSWPIAAIPAGASNGSPINTLPINGMSYALLICYSNGYAIIAGNSGLAGNADSPFPAQGLFSAFDNKIFLLNCLEFLNPNSAARRSVA